MFDLMLILASLIAAVFGGVLGRVTLSRSSLTRRPFNRKVIMIVGASVGLLGGISMVIFTSVLAMASGEAITAARIIVAFIEVFMPLTAGVLIGFNAIGSRLV